MNIFLNPKQGLLLVKQSDIQVAILADLLACQETKSADPVVDLHKYHAMVRFHDDFGGIEVLIRIGCVPTTLNKEPNRQFAVSASIAWCENIKKEAIFVDTAAYLLRSSYTCRRKLEMSS
jgi:hypothetical protein